MSTPVNTSSTDSQMHNNIMAAGSKDRPPMLGPGRYSQWRSRFLRFNQNVLKEVNDFRAKRLPNIKGKSSSTRQSASTRHKGKEVAKPITPQFESVSEEDSDPEQAQRDKEMQKNLALLANALNVRDMGHYAKGMQEAKWVKDSRIGEHIIVTWQQIQDVFTEENPVLLVSHWNSWKFCQEDSSRSVKVLKLKNFKKDATLKLFKNDAQGHYVKYKFKEQAQSKKLLVFFTNRVTTLDLPPLSGVKPCSGHSQFKLLAIMAVGEPSGYVMSINGLDAGNPLHVQNSDRTKNKYGFIDGICLKETYATSDVFSAQWDILWKELNETYDKVDGSVVYNLLQKINTVKQWVVLVRSSLLIRDPLPEVKDAYNVVSREESHKGVPESFGVTKTKMNASSFAARSVNNGNNNSNIRSYNNTNNNTKGNVSSNRGPNANLNYKNYGKIGHTIKRCYELVGFPTGFKRSSNFVKQGFNANVDVKQNEKMSFGNTSPGFTSEQMKKLLSLINETPSASIHANMACLNL
ncbi:hypothetical protein Tco_0872772 [Tanacetum coccineum]